MSYNIYDRVYDLSDSYSIGITKIFDWLWLGGEDDVDFPLYGREFIHQDRVALMENKPIDIDSKVTVWIDFRDIQGDNRRVYIPPNVVYISIPFRDGDLEKARLSWDMAKRLIDNKTNKDKFLITCHAGVSRSATFVLWILAEQFGFKEAWEMLKRKRKEIEPDRAFKPFINELNDKYSFLKNQNSQEAG